MTDYNLINIDRKNRKSVTLRSVGFASFILLQTILSIVLGLAVFAACAFIVHMISKMGLLDTINGLLGRTMVTFTESKLIALSAVFGLAVAVIRVLFEMVYILLVNASFKLIGGVPVGLYTATVDTVSTANREESKPRSVQSDKIEGVMPISQLRRMKEANPVLTQQIENKDETTSFSPVQEPPATPVNPSLRALVSNVNKEDLDNGE